MEEIGLADAVAAARDQLMTAATSGASADLAFLVGPVELTAFRQICCLRWLGCFGCQPTSRAFPSLPGVLSQCSTALLTSAKS